MSDSIDIAILTLFMGCSENRDIFKLEIAEKIVPVLNTMGFSNIAIEDIYPGCVLLKPYTKVEFQSIVPKGICINELIDFCLEKHKPKYIIYIDGSRKISSTYIIELAKSFIDGNSDVVFAERIGKNKAISPERWAIEKFELFLLEEKYNISELPDGQCGLWGFKVFDSADKKIDIKCTGYEVELDLLSQALKKNHKYQFIPIKVENPKKVTGFKEDDHIKKLDFISSRESLKKHHILASMHKFSKEKIKLPEKYIEAVEKWSFV